MSDSITKYYELIEEGKITETTESTSISDSTISKALVIKKINEIKNILLFCGNKSGMSNDDASFMAIRSINVLIDEIKGN
tara:strand:- start:476 stop:715 length:240 start_codon:yes stop_codon:yes gene_type:complete